MTQHENTLLPLIHPGEILKLEFMEPLNISQNFLAKAISVPPRRINEIVQGKRSITADTALRLGRFFGMTPEFWLNLQNHYELDLLKQSEKNTVFSKIKRFKPFAAAIL